MQINWGTEFIGLVRDQHSNKEPSIWRGSTLILPVSLVSNASLHHPQ